MKAIAYDTCKQLPTLQELSDPVCPPDGVLIQVKATGVCRSDWHAWQGHDPVPLPMVPGHEFAGVVAEVGAQVSNWRVGDRVTVPFACGCGHCEWCRLGATHVCPDQTQPGFTHWGSFAELVAVHAADANLVRLPESISYVDAAALGCRFATAYRGVVSQARLQPGEWLVVHGCGGVGLSAVMIGHALGAHVVAVDLNTQALQLARAVGAETAVIADRDVVDEIERLTGGGAHVSVDALGSVQTMQNSIDSLRRQGRHVQLGLMLGDASQASVPIGRMIAQELSIIGGHGMPARDYPELLSLVAAGKLRPGKLVGKRIGLAEAGEALAAMSAPAAQAGMTVVEVEVG